MIRAVAGSPAVPRELHEKQRQKIKRRGAGGGSRFFTAGFCFSVLSVGLSVPRGVQVNCHQREVTLEGPGGEGG